jgi:hypothetical protein
MACSGRASAAALLALTATAYAEPVAIEAGAARLSLATPARDAGIAGTVSLGVGAAALKHVDLMLRGHITIGDDGAVTALGPYVQHRLHPPVFVGYGLSIARVLGPAVDEPAVRASGLGLGAEVRAGVRFGNVGINVHALPIWVFASDSVQSDTRLRGALELGVTVGYQR